MLINDWKELHDGSFEYFKMLKNSTKSWARYNLNKCADEGEDLPEKPKRKPKIEEFDFKEISDRMTTFAGFTKDFEKSVVIHKDSDDSCHGESDFECLSDSNNSSAEEHEMIESIEQIGPLKDILEQPNNLAPRNADVENLKNKKEKEDLNPFVNQKVPKKNESLRAILITAPKKDCEKHVRFNVHKEEILSIAKESDYVSDQIDLESKPKKVCETHVEFIEQNEEIPSIAKESDDVTNQIDLDTYKEIFSKLIPAALNSNFKVLDFNKQFQSCHSVFKALLDEDTKEIFEQKVMCSYCLASPGTIQSIFSKEYYCDECAEFDEEEIGNNSESLSLN